MLIYELNNQEYFLLCTLVKKIQNVLRFSSHVTDMIRFMKIIS